MTNLEKVQQSLEGNTVLENKPIKFKTVNIHGKEYVMVNERLLYFWEHYKQYSIITEIISVTDEKIIMKATIKNENEKVISTGHAYEMANNGLINKTSYIENCETSALGRALANMGIGINTSIASAEEVTSAIKAQTNISKPNTPKKYLHDESDKQKLEEIEKWLLDLNTGNKRRAGEKLKELTTFTKDGKTFNGVTDVVYLKSPKQIDIIHSKVKQMKIESGELSASIEEEIPFTEEIPF